MIDFIIEALFSTDGYSVAFSPLLALLPALGSSIYGMAQQGRLKKDLEKEKDKASSAHDAAIKAIRDINFEPSQGIRDAFGSMETAGQELGRQGQARTDETTAQLIAAMGSRDMAAAGVRGLDKSFAAQQQAEAAGTNMKLQAQMGLAQANEAGNQAEIQSDLGLEQRLLEIAGGAYNSAQKGIYDTDAEMTSSVMGLGNLGTQGLMGLAQAQATPPPTTNNYYSVEDGGYIGEQGGVTEGEFDHASNKKAIVDEENGQKEGELTGGEIVFNPEQTADITDMVEQADAEGLLMLLQELFNEPQFQKS